ncbi:MAG: KpsF/GutQ family sugar-phosphate isomerase [Elusimicrobia bacterium]|nr:KpsF/GutQ family sugar-phosphate isomerase [Elusimicrobiota bacterium]
MNNFKRAIETLTIEANAVKDQIKNLDSGFKAAAEIIYACKGKIIVMGLGKSGLIGRKIAATMSSVGVPAAFLHPSESLHGDIGAILKDDVVIMLSYSGETEEIKKVAPVLKRMKVKAIAMTGNAKSPSWKSCDAIVNCKVSKEACPHNLAPTSSSTAMLAMGDALALTVSERKGFKSENLALFHPLGSIGKRLTMLVSDVMRKGKNNPVVKETSLVKDALFIMTGTKIGAANVVNSKGRLSGFFTDGDLRRSLQKNPNILNKKISAVMTKKPKTVSPEMLAVEAAKIISKYKIDNVPVVDVSGEPVGILDESDLMAEGLK